MRETFIKADILLTDDELMFFFFYHDKVMTKG